MERHQANVHVDAQSQGQMRRIWRFEGYDEINYSTTEAGRALLTKLGQMRDGPYYVRAHYMLCSGDGTGRPKWGSSNVYMVDAHGDPVYDWRVIDEILDTIIACGCVPFVEIGFMPEALSSAPEGTVYDSLSDGGWRYPPTDYERWQELMRRLAEHCLSRYGLREVQRWYWELWNEPDIFYWAGTLQEYCRLWDHTVAGITAVLPQALLCGPGTTNPSSAKAAAFLRGFLEHCASGRNAVTGRTGSRLDVITFHTKGGGYRRDSAAAKQTPSIHALVRNVVCGFEIIQAFPQFHQRQVILTECDPDGMAAFGKHDNENLTFRNTEYYASYVASAVCKMSDVEAEGCARVDGMLTWAFEFEDRELFEGLRTLSTHGIDKPVLNVFRLLARLGGTRLQALCDGSRDPMGQEGSDATDQPPDVSVLASLDESGGLAVFLASHHDDWDVSGETQVTFSISGLSEGRRYRLVRYGVDRDRGNAHTAWQVMGGPQVPSVEQYAALKDAARVVPEELGMVMVEHEMVQWQDTLLSHSVTLWSLEPV